VLRSKGFRNSRGFGPVKKRFIYTALSSLALLALTIPTIVIAQQQQQQPAPRRPDQGAASSTTPGRTGRRVERPSAAAPAGAVTADGIEGDLAEALTVIQENYVDGSKIEYNNVFKSSIIGMLRSLDPHSNFYDAKEFEEQRADWRSEYYGIGATIGDRRIDDRTDTYILATFEETPAYKAGLRFGDRIVEVDGQSVKGRNSSDVRDRLRGPRGSSVKVTVERASTGNKETVEITRDAVSQPTVPDSYMIRPGVGYIDMQRGFNYTTADEFVAALERLRAQGMTSLVLDLRNNGGGILDQAVKVAEQFLPDGQLILTQKGRSRRSGGERPYKSSNANPDQSPLVVLVNRGTASASEIVAGALQDHDRALIIGETTFGKGLVQSIMPLDYGTALTLTTSKYYTPSGRLLQRDYSQTGFYDYIYRGGIGSQDEPEAEKQPEPKKGTERHTDSGRPIYDGGGIAPDEGVKPRLISVPQQRLIDPVFAFAREVVNGRVAGFESFKVARMPDFGHNLEAKDFTVDEKLFKAFKDFVARKGQGYKLTEQQLDKNREFVQRQLRYDMATAAYGTVKAAQVLVADDPQVSKAIELLPRARDLAANAQRGQKKSYE
jgi:carboxyl-terminal processing protease